MEALRTDSHPLGSKGLQAVSQMLSALPPVGLGIPEAGSKHGQWARCISGQAGVENMGQVCQLAGRYGEHGPGVSGAGRCGEHEPGVSGKGRCGEHGPGV